MHPQQYVIGPNEHLKEVFKWRRRAQGRKGGPYDLAWSVPITVHIDLDECRCDVQHLAERADVLACVDDEEFAEVQRVMALISRIVVRPVSARHRAQQEGEAAHFEQLDETMGPDFLEFVK